MKELDRNYTGEELKYIGFPVTNFYKDFRRMLPYIKDRAALKEIKIIPAKGD